MLNKMVRIEMKASYHSFAFLMAMGLLFCSAQSVVHANPIVLAYAPYAPAPSILTKAPPPSHSACPPTRTPTKSPPPPASPPPPLPSSPPPPAPKYAPPPPPFTPPPPPFMIGAAVEGVIYCASCKLKGYDPSLNASPLPGIPTKLLCNSTKKGLTINGNATTDGKGYYLIQAQNKNPNQMKSCRLVVRMPIWCNKPISPRGSKAGFPLHFEKIYKFGTSQIALFTTAFMEFGPSSKELCPKRP